MTMAETNELPKTMRALVLTSRDQPLTVETVPTPQPTIGSAVVQILTAKIISYTREVYDGTRPYPFPTPIVPGTSAIGRYVHRVLPLLETRWCQSQTMMAHILTWNQGRGSRT